MYPSGFTFLIIANATAPPPALLFTNVNGRPRYFSAFTAVARVVISPSCPGAEQISSVINRIGSKKIDEEDQIAIVLDAAPEAYQAILTSEQRFKGTNLTMDDLQLAMDQHWRQIKPKNKSSGDDDNEIALSAFQGK